MIALLNKDFQVYRPAFVAWVLLITVSCSLPFCIGMLMLLIYFPIYGLIVLGPATGLIALLRKHLGLYRAACIVVLSVFIIFLTAYVSPLLILSIDHRANLPESFPNYALIGQGLTICVAAAFGGCAFAIERRDRSADFLAMMPVCRWHIVASKITLSAFAILTLWIIHSTLLYLDRAFMQESSHEPLFWAYAFPGAMILLAFGVSWLFSTLIKSPAISGCLGLATLLLIVIVREQMMILVHPPTPVQMLHARDLAPLPFYIVPHNADVLIAVAAALMGASCVLAGSLIFTQRVSP